MNNLNIDLIKSGVNIIDVIGNYVPLKKAGKNYQACCPFHTEKTPSFSVSDNKQFYHCFGCGAHGDVIGFLQDYLNIDFIEAVKMIGGEIDNLPPVKLNQNIMRSNIRLPLNKEPHNLEEMKVFLASKCEEIQGKFFYGRSQVIFTTDIYKNKVSLALIEAKNFPIKHYKKSFLYGSCVVFGGIEKDKDVYLVECLFNARDFHKISGSPVICFFEPLNLRFIYDDLKRITKSVLVIAETEESLYQADKLNLMNCYFKKLENKVEFDNV